ncbi:flagellar hook assembly protein FlgD [Pseudalkalibacillus sp. SCS-8]|uniref:flagellar hook assembly protein FlgD n=1 Tax=Pseudalkalibacillus nanhaiensis TaxID=3115291 RepID=UPI0032DAC80C
MVNQIDPSLFLPDSQTRKTGGSNLGKDDFLKILVAQLANQDPLKPMEDREFISQMANFSSLEQMVNMNQTLSNWMTHQNNGQLLQYSELIGRKIDWVDSETGADQQTGVVAKVHFERGETVIELENGTKVTPDQVVTVSK